MTAVEWLYNDLFPKKLDGFSEGEWEIIDKAFHQAKEMEKQQIIDAQSFAISNADMSNNRGYFDCEKYYYGTYANNHIVDTNKITSSKTEISDEEIEKAGTTFHWDFRGATELELSAFIFGAKWYREQLKKD